MKEIEIRSLVEYIQFVEKISPDFSLSRGQEQDKELLPSVLRKDDTGLRIYSKAKAKLFIEDFKMNSFQYTKHFESDNDNEWLVYAQHFGVPTCLLDFTYSHLISLMFAVENAFRYTDDADEQSVVWFLNPNKLNLKAINRTEIINLSTETIEMNDAEYPCVVTTRKNNSRMAAQNGLFVYFQQDSAPLEQLDISEEILKKVVIPHNCGKEILKSLFTMGIRFDDIYPELSSVSKDILLKNNVMEYYKMEEENE